MCPHGLCPKTKNPTHVPPLRSLETPVAIEYLLSQFSDRTIEILGAMADVLEVVRIEETHGRIALL